MAKKEKEKQEVIVLDPIKKEADELVNKIVKTESKEELEELYEKFNLNNTKKNVTRINSLNELLDKVNEQAAERFTKRPGEISNKEVLDYMNAIQNQIERSQKIVEGIKEINAVQVNNTQNNTVNITVDSQDLANLNRESRDNIMEVISSILKMGQQPNSEVPTITTPEEIKTEPQEIVEVIDTDELQNVLDDEFSGDD